jgi:hypothetical protein
MSTPSSRSTPTIPTFRRFAKLIEEQGYRASFEGIAYRYLRVDDFLDWTSRALWNPGQNISRKARRRR